MDSQIYFRKNADEVLPPGEAASGTVLSMHWETTLGEVAERLKHQHYVLATDDSGRVTGIASRSRIQQRLECHNRFERSRWQQMPLAALLSVTFSPSDEQAKIRMKDSVACTPIADGDRLFGLAIEDDLFLSWRRLEPMFSVALSDPLTGLFSRLAYERRLTEEWGRAARTGFSVAVVIVDIDNFKRINDTLGHPAGDVVLRSVGHEMEASVRSYDVVARLGGDEFVALCLGCDPETIVIPVERIQQSIGLMNLTVDGDPVPVTASIGAAVRHDGFDQSDPRELFSAADECLYHAKASRESAWKVELGTDCSGIPEPVRYVPGLGSTVRRSEHSVGR